MLIVFIILALISIVFFGYSVQLSKHTHEINNSIDKANQEKEKELEKNIQEIENLKKNISDKRQQLEEIQKDVTITIDNQKKLSQEAFQNYCDILLKSYDEKEKEYQDSIDLLNDSYYQQQSKIIDELQNSKKEIAEAIAKEEAVLDKIRQTRAAAIQAQIKEKEIEQELSFYCLQVSDNEMKDISVLESIKPKLNNPRILSMLIWQTYWRTPMTKLCNNVIGNTVKTGVYKITNQKTKECYIGQAVDLASRFKDHAKCGLGIDTPPANKLYKSMQEYGIWNFSWEVLEVCPKDQLDEKEKYYIELYQSKEYGFNIQAGNK